MVDESPEDKAARAAAEKALALQTAREKLVRSLAEESDDNPRGQHQRWLNLWDEYLAMPLDKRWTERRLALVKRLRHEPTV